MWVNIKSILELQLKVLLYSLWELEEMAIVDFCFPQILFAFK